MSNNWLRPRRLEDSLVSYLLGVQPLIEAAVVVPRSNGAGDDDAADGDGAEEGKAAALRNVVDEIKFQTASAATDKRTSALLELLVQAAGPKAAVVALARCAPYAAFIAHNRHGSHVLQTLLSMVGEHLREKQQAAARSSAASGSGAGWTVDRSAASKGTGDEAEEDDAEWAQEAEAVVALLWDNLVGLTGAVEGDAENSEAAGGAGGGGAAASPRDVVQSLVALSCDVCAAHALRALLCVLCGAPVVQERRGKQARHGQAAGATLAEPSALRTQPRAPPHPALRALWERTVALLAGPRSSRGSGGDASAEAGCASAVELQHMSCDSSGAATLVLLLQLEATANITHRGHGGGGGASRGGGPAGGGVEEDDGPLADWSNQATFGVLGEPRAPLAHSAKGGAKGSDAVPSAETSPGLRLLLRLLEFDDLNASTGSASSSGTTSGGGDSGGGAVPTCRAADVVYGLAGEASASHLLETALRVLPNGQFEVLVRTCLIGSLNE
jgi:hypothetical protein